MDGAEEYFCVDPKPVEICRLSRASRCMMGATDYSSAPAMVGEMFAALYNDDLNKMLRLLQAYLLTVPYCNNANSEGHYQQMLCIIFSLMGRYVDVEVHTPRGHVDAVMRTSTILYPFELKMDKSADVAMKQTNLRDYASKFSLSNLPVVKVGINFNSDQLTISDWKIEVQKV